MTNRRAIGIGIGLFVAGLLSGAVAGFLAGSWVIFFIYLLGAVIAGVSFVVVHLLNLGGWKWVFPALIILAGVIGLVSYGGPVVTSRAQTFLAALPTATEPQPFAAPFDAESRATPGVEVPETKVTVLAADAGVLFFNVGPLPADLHVSLACNIGFTSTDVQTLAYVEGSSYSDWALDTETSGLLPPAAVGTFACLYQDLRVERGGGALEETPESAVAPDDFPLWEGYGLTGLGSFVPNPNTFSVVETIYEEAAWSQPDFVPPWPPHSPDPSRQDCPKVDGQKVWCSVMIRPGDVVIWNADAISTPMGSYLYPSGGWFTNNTTHQIEVSFLFGELVVIEPGEDQTTVDADQMARVLLKLVVSTNGLTNAAYLGEIPIH